MADVINSAYDPLLQSYHTSSLTVDGYGMSNLFSMERAHRSKGMLLERFIRSPVMLSAQFKFPLQLLYILIELRLDINDIIKLTVGTSKEVRAIKNSFSVRRDEGDINSIIMLVFSDPTKLDSVCLPEAVPGSELCTKYTNSQRLTVNNVSQSSPPLPISTPIHVGRGVITSDININILHWTGHKPLLIKSLELWTQLPMNDRRHGDSTIGPCKLFEDFKQLLINRETAGCDRCRPAVPLVYNSNIREERGKRKREREKEEIPINKELKLADPPLQYMDSITHNLMTLPVLLPSGYYVDQSTVDKSIELDTMNGRPPTDPFTGIPYTSRPAFCPLLKTSIDEYVSSIEGQVERTVGTAEDILKHKQMLNNRASSNDESVDKPIERRRTLSSKKPASSERAVMQDDAHSSIGKVNEVDITHERLVTDSLDLALSSLFPPSLPSPPSSSNAPEL
ncbi:PREDICTED: RING finger protein 37-like [Amphimedon queenslandica]|uniref:U-box domain-containing protein n=2 Tax=Amphimedon queenslandica TaxID=400682 RepID=A0AAN0K4H0_AMPQE|nr:PREDICTED: RING finger protein 37-like [Amphimedon queenslandica]|eukprot:XP_019864428.1 PREDICTED: RING finger protein 37-like [Amphimedon queenslandica]